MLTDIPLQWLRQIWFWLFMHIQTKLVKNNFSFLKLNSQNTTISRNFPLILPPIPSNRCCASSGLSGALTSSWSSRIKKTKNQTEEEKFGSEPERQIGLASIGLKVKRRDNKQEKLPVITGFNIFLFLSDPFILSLPPFFFLSFFWRKDPRLKTGLLKLGLICNAPLTLGVNRRFVI